MRALRVACVGLLLLSLSIAASVAAGPRRGLVDPALRERERQRTASAVAALAPGTPGTTDLYVVAFGGDSSAAAFGNEADYLGRLMTTRFGTGGRTLTLINRVEAAQAAPTPMATLENLRDALHGVGRTMNRDEDVLLLFLTMHGTSQHFLFLRRDPDYWDLLAPETLRALLDASGIRNRVIVTTACYSGGLLKSLRDPDTLVIAASAANRRSYGCNPEADATFFGRAWMIEGLNETTDFVAAFESAKARIDARERGAGLRPSRPQIAIGASILPRLERWRAQLTPGPALAYEMPSPAAAPASPAGRGIDDGAGRRK